VLPKVAKAGTRHSERNHRTTERQTQGRSDRRWRRGSRTSFGTAVGAMPAATAVAAVARVASMARVAMPAVAKDCAVGVATVEEGMEARERSERSHCTVERPTQYKSVRRCQRMSRTMIGTQAVAPVALVGMGVLVMVAAEAEAVEATECSERSHYTLLRPTQYRSVRCCRHGSRTRFGTGAAQTARAEARAETAETAWAAAAKAGETAVATEVEQTAAPRVARGCEGGLGEPAAQTAAGSARTPCRPRCCLASRCTGVGWTGGCSSPGRLAEEEEGRMARHRR